jgi:hypothetical protein
VAITMPDYIPPATGDDLSAMTDATLAEWQAGWQVHTARGILASKEWDRRLAIRQMHEQFQLDQRLMDANVKAMRFAAVLSVLGTLAGAALGAYLSKP